MVEMVGMEITRPGQRNVVYDRLRLQILGFHLPPGEMLSENLLSSQMGLSRPVVRDALSQLSEEGYVVVYPQRGTAVTELDMGRVKQSVFSHIVLEQAVIEEVCRRGLSEGEIGLLEEALAHHKAMTGKEDAVSLIAEELRFHYLLSSFCGRESIWEMFRTMDCDLLRVNYLQYSTFNYKIHMSSLTSWEHVQVEERLLLDHLKRGDVEAAGLICSSHFNTALWNADTLKGIYPQFFAGPS